MDHSKLKKRRDYKNLKRLFCVTANFFQAVHENKNETMYASYLNIKNVILSNAKMQISLRVFILYQRRRIITGDKIKAWLNLNREY